MPKGKKSADAANEVRNQLEDGGMTEEDILTLAPPESEAAEEPVMNAEETKEILEVVKGLKDEMEAMKLKLASSGTAPAMQEQLGRVITRGEAQDFIDTPLPETSFFAQNPYQLCILFNSEERHDRHGDKKKIPQFPILFHSWAGPGSEFPNPAHPKRDIKMGRYNLHHQQLITITDEDLSNAKLNLPGDLRTKEGFRHDGEPEFPLMRCLEKILRHEELGIKFFTAAEFQMMTAAQYEIEWGKKEKEDLLAAKMAALRAKRGPGVEKMGSKELAGV